MTLLLVLNIVFSGKTISYGKESNSLDKSFSEEKEVLVNPELNFGQN